MNMPPNTRLRDILWPQIDGWHVIPLGIVIALSIIVLPLAISQAIERLFR
jgi:hypothetical protein